MTNQNIITSIHRLGQDGADANLDSNIPPRRNRKLANRLANINPNAYPTVLLHDRNCPLAVILLNERGFAYTQIEFITDVS